VARPRACGEPDCPPAGTSLPRRPLAGPAAVAQLDSPPSAPHTWTSPELVGHGSNTATRQWQVVNRHWDASGFTGRTMVSPQVPLHPHLYRQTARDVGKRPAHSCRLYRASPAVPARPPRPGVGRREGGGKSRAAV
jgi:hypothetical protein